MSALGEEAIRIVETAFAAAVDDSLWAEVTEQVIAATGTKGSFLGVLDHRTGQAARCLLTNATARAYEEYIAGMSRFDPQARKVATVDRTGVYVDMDHVDWSDPSSADYMKWQIDRLGWHSHVTVASRLDDNHCSGMSFHLAKEDGHRVRDVRRFLLPISEALSHALQLSFLHNDKLTHEYWLGASAGRDPHAALLLGERGDVLRMNAAAERLIVAGSPLTLRVGRLCCRTVREQARLDALVNRAVAASGPVPGVALLGGVAEQKWFVRTSPVVRRRRLMVIDEPAALLTLRPLRPGRRANDALWRELFELTPTEAKVADLLRCGLSAEAVGLKLGIRAATVRTHTKMIHEKTETRRNAELAHLLTLLASQR